MNAFDILPLRLIPGSFCYNFFNHLAVEVRDIPVLLVRLLLSCLEGFANIADRQR